MRRRKSYPVRITLTPTQAADLNSFLIMRQYQYRRSPALKRAAAAVSAAIDASDAEFAALLAADEVAARRSYRERQAAAQKAKRGRHAH